MHAFIANNGNNMRNKQFDIMLAIGIIFVIMGHSHQPAFLFYPAYAFHMGLFFFISGYFFKPQSTFQEKLRFIYKKIKSQLIPYFVLVLFFGLLTQLLKKFNINLGTEINTESIFWGTFERADHFTLYLSAWFLFTLFIVNLIGVLIYNNKTIPNLIIFTLCGIALLLLLEAGRHNTRGWSLQIFRSGYGVFFFSLGFIFKQYEPLLKKWLLKPWIIVCIFTTIDILTTQFGGITYSILLGDIGNEHVWLPIITTTGIILLTYVVSFLVTHITSDNSWLLLIGRNTFSIMIWHFTAFLIVNMILYQLGYFPIEKLSDVYFKHQINNTWPIYISAALLIPIAIAIAYEKINSIISKNIYLLKSRR